jgi:hypothetical protein
MKSRHAQRRHELGNTIRCNGVTNPPSRDTITTNQTEL